MNAAWDEEIDDADKAAALAEIAEDTLIALDIARESEAERIEADVERQLADLEREGS